jgi:hypothetical protein
MFRNVFQVGSRISILRTIVLGTALLVHPCGMLAQRGAGGGRTGGGVAGGGGLSSTGKATGVDVKDDLKDFHEAIALEATSQQIVEYAAMMKSTEAAAAELKNFTEQLGKETSASEFTARSAALDQAIEKARTENKKFLDGFSEPQKSGLKENIKKLAKADSDLAQEAKALDLEVESAKASGSRIGNPQIANLTQSLERALESFRTEQAALGEEMSIGAANNGSTFNLPPLTTSVNLANQPIAIPTSGVLSKGAAEGGLNTFKLELTADLSDLQRNLTDVLGAQLDKAERCGEHVQIHSAILAGSDPASVVTVQLHIERWACLGREANEMVEGNGTIEVKLIPSVGPDGTLRLTAETGRIDAQGFIAEMLRSGSLGDRLRDKITESVLSVLRPSGDFNAALPPAARTHATLQRVRFQGTGSGRLLAILNGEIRVSNEQLIALTGQLKAGELKASESKEKESSTPATVQGSLPR